MYSVFFHSTSSVSFSGGDKSIIVYDVAAVEAVAQKMADGVHVSALEEEERVLVKISAPPGNNGV